MSFMVTVGLKVLKNRLSEYVKRAAAGETVLISDRNKVVAELVPPSLGREPVVADAMLAEAIRSGWISPALDPPGPLPPARPVAKFDQILEELNSERDDR